MNTQDVTLSSLVTPFAEPFASALFLFSCVTLASDVTFCRMSMSMPGCCRARQMSMRCC